MALSRSCFRCCQAFLLLVLALVLAGCNGFFVNGGGGGAVCGGQGGFTLDVVNQDPNTGLVTGLHGGTTISGAAGKDGTGAQGCVKTVGTPLGNPQPVPGGRAPATWAGTFSTFDQCTNNFPLAWGPGTIPLHVTTTVGTCFVPPIGSQFLLTNSLPPTLTASGTGLTSSRGMPQLRVYSVANALLSTSLATAVAPNGSSATFTFPKNSNGTALGGGEYGYTIANQNPAGTFTDVGGDILSLGTADTSNVTPYGVDADHTIVSASGCTRGYCWTASHEGVYPVTTLYSSNTLKVSGYSVPVGTQPVAVKLYNYKSWTTTSGTPPDVTTTTTTGASRALVANFGSRSVSVVDVVNTAVVNTVAVGAQPIALLVKPDFTKGYVANFGSATVSEIDLTTNTQARVVNVGANPTSLVVCVGQIDIYESRFPL